MIKEVEGTFGAVFIVVENENGSTTWIPKDPANADYQRYLNPEAGQSTPIVTSDE